MYISSEEMAESTRTCSEGNAEVQENTEKHLEFNEIRTHDAGV